MKLIRKVWREHRYPLLALFFSWGLYFSILFTRMIRLKPDGLYVGHQNVWGDWALHIGIANIFAFKSPQLWFAYHPIYAGGKFTYGWLVNAISGLLMRLGFTLPYSFIIPSIILALALLLGIYTLFFLMHRSKAVTLLTISFFLLSAGLGFINFGKEYLQGSSTFAYPIRDYSSIPAYDWYAGNVVVGLLVPQRAFLLGMTIGVWVVVGLLYVVTHRTTLTPAIQKQLLVLAGLGAGILPIAHSHSLIVLMIITGLMCLVEIKLWRLLLWYVVPAGVLSSILYFIFISGGIQNSSFMQWYPGWTATGGLWDWLYLWGYVWGPMLPLALLGLVLVYRQRQRIVLAAYMGAFVAFAIANLVLFQPIRWDNTKIFWWSYLFFSGLAAVVIVTMWSRRSWLVRSSAVLLVVTLTATGSLEIIRLSRVAAHEFMVTNTDDMELGLRIRQTTGPLDRFLTAPQHNQFIMVWGVRPILMGYTAWVWNFGFEHEQRDQDIRRMYQGGSATDELLIYYDVSYVVIGPAERNDLLANEEYFRQRFPLAFRNQQYRIYDTRSLF